MFLGVGNGMRRHHGSEVYKTSKYRILPTRIIDPFGYRV